MVDSTCVMQSVFPSSSQQGDALVESVSFGRFRTQNIEWDKYSAFNQNPYLEEAQRLAKPGLVAQRKALFEAHFKRPVAVKVPGLLKVGIMDSKNAVQKNDFNKENFYGEPRKNMMDSAKSTSGLYIKATKDSTDVLCRVDHPPTAALVMSHSGEVQNSIRNDAVPENKNIRNTLIQMDGPGSDMAAGAFEDLKISQQLDTLHDTSALNQSEIVNTSTSPVAIRLDKIPAQEPADKFVFASTVDSEPAFCSSNSLTSVKKRAVLSPCKLRSQVLRMKENNAPENSKASETGMVTWKRVVTKPFGVSIKQNSGLPATQKPLTVEELDSVKYPVNSVGTRGSKLHSDRVMADLDGYEALSSNRKLSAEPDLKPAAMQLKQKMNITWPSMTSMRKSVGQKERGKGNTPANSLRTKSISTPSAMLKTSSRAPANQVISDATNIGKHTLPSSNTSSFGRKSTIQPHAKSQSKYGSKVTQMNSTLTLSQNNLKKPLPKAGHASVDPSCNFERVKMPTTAPNCRGRIKRLDVRVSKESYSHMRESLQKSVQTSAARQFDNKGSKRPSIRLHEQMSVIKAIKRPPTTVLTPFRFRSDERAAIRKQVRGNSIAPKLEFKSSPEAVNPSQIKRKVADLSNSKLHLSSNSQQQQKGESRQVTNHKK